MGMKIDMETEMNMVRLDTLKACATDKLQYSKNKKSRMIFIPYEASCSYLCTCT